MFIRPITFVWLFFVYLALSAILGATLYPGSLWCFLVFSVAFGLLFATFGQKADYPHIFFVVMLFAGFWLKTAYLLTTDAFIQEPTGNFAELPAEWDQVLWVSSLGAVGYLIGRLVVARLWVASDDNATINAPANYTRFRIFCWLAIVIASLAIIGLNVDLRLVVRGEIPPVILSWPFGGIFAITMDIGIALAFAIVLTWERGRDRSVSLGFAALCVQAAILSISTLSRAVYLFQTLPFLVTEIADILRRRRRLAIALILIWAGFAAAVPAATSLMRLSNAGVNRLPDLIMPSFLGRSRYAENDPRARESQAFQIALMTNHFTALASNLLIMRWSGLEGVMATVAYHEKNFRLWNEAAFRRRGYGQPDLYTAEISGMKYGAEEAAKSHYASPAGPIAFFYFSGSLTFVAFGMAMVALALRAIGRLWAKIFPDRLPLALTGWYLAFVALQMSGSLQQVAAGPLFVTGLYLAARGMHALMRGRPQLP
jgi:hypothetical protein